MSVAVTACVVVAFGAAVWNQGWDRGNLGPALGRSFTITLFITVAQVVTSILAAYAFAFLRFPFKTLVFAFFMATLLLPLEVTLLANVQTIRELGWINSNAGLVLPFAATAFGTFLIRQGFRGVPPEVHDATRLDGYGHMGFLWRFAVPLTRPVIASFTVIAALGAWNQYLWPQAIIDDERSADGPDPAEDDRGHRHHQRQHRHRRRTDRDAAGACCYSSPSRARSSAASPPAR